MNKINGKYYVGSSNNIYKRFNQHKLNLKRNCHKNSHLQSSWNKYGKNIFNFITIEEVEKKKLIDTEQRYLDAAHDEKNKCYNSIFIAGRVEMTDEIKKKLSDSHLGLLKGEKHPLWGKHLSPETRKKLRLANLGKQRTQISIEKSRLGNIGKHSGKNNPNFGKHRSNETIEKIRLKSIGRKHTDETKLKMSLTKIGKHYSELSVKKSAETRSKFWNFLNPEKIVVEFKNLSSFCKERGLDKSAMSNVFKGKASHHKGWKSINSI